MGINEAGKICHTVLFPALVFPNILVKGVDSVIMNYERLLSMSTNKMTSESSSPRSLNFSSKIASLSWVVAFMMVRVTVALFKLRPQR